MVGNGGGGKANSPSPPSPTPRVGGSPHSSPGGGCPIISTNPSLSIHPLKSEADAFSGKPFCLNTSLAYSVTVTVGTSGGFSPNAVHGL